MKLLLDENLSHKLLADLGQAFPGSTHVRDVGLASAGDDPIWNFAKDSGYVIVTQDADFYDRSLIDGHPPKVIWLTTGNTATPTIRDLLRRHAEAIQGFGADADLACLQIS